MRRPIISLMLLLGLSAPVIGAEPTLQDNPPDRYVVVKGDTLWDISGRFLKQPWRWPEIWGMNKDQIKNPHRIYPGDVIVLERGADGSARLRLASGTVKLSPQVRAEPLEGAIPSIPPSVIEPFLTRPLVIAPGGLESAPRVLGAREDHVVMGRGDKVIATGLTPEAGTLYYIYRPGRSLKDPDTGELLGVEAVYLGDARVDNFDKVSTLEIIKSTQEVHRNDRLIPTPRYPGFPNYAPRAPEKPIAGRIMAVHGGLGEAGKLDVVVINRGSQEGVVPGDVLAIYRSSTPVTSGRESISLPDDRVGLLFVFRTFDRVAYGLVMDSSRPINVRDMVRNP